VITVTCPTCRTQLQAPPEILGRTARCGKCGQQFTVTEPRPEDSDPGSPVLAPPQHLPQPSELPTSGYAIASLVLGICAIPGAFCYGVPGLVCGILGIVFSNTARRAIQTRQAGGGSAGMATAGKVCGLVGLALAALFWCFMFFGFCAFSRMVGRIR